jgi:glycerol-3-phosphate dehydrogenase
MSASLPVFDVAVVGGGVVGCAVLRALTLEGARCVLIERARDLLDGASKGNSAILHTGFDASEDSLELACMREGYRLYHEVKERLGLPVLATSALVVAWSAEELARLPQIVARARCNAVEVREIGQEELRAREPHLASDALGAVLVPGEQVIDPWSAPLAHALQALANGASILRGCELRGGARRGDLWTLATTKGPVRARVVVNCAGLFADLVEAIARPAPFRICPRKGQFVVLDKPAAALVGAILLPVPTEHSKGVLLARTVFGNLLVGPTAEDQEDREDTSVDRDTLQRLLAHARRVIPALAAARVTATYAGLRPATESMAYQIEAVPEQSWITVCGIRSTGLTAALGIAALVARLHRHHFAQPRPLADPVWTPVPNLAEHLPRPWQLPGTGEIVCHCERVTRGEIERALEGPLPAGDLGGLRRRTRCLMGRCQGFYCLARIMALAGGRLAPPGLAPVAA